MLSARQGRDSRAGGHASAGRARRGRGLAERTHLARILLSILYPLSVFRKRRFGRSSAHSLAERPAEFAAWCEGRTGYPVVDAAMRQLVQTGWMHNRARMIVASFLVKDLLIDWRWGERFFMQHLVDGDPAPTTAAGSGRPAWAPMPRPISRLQPGSARGEVRPGRGLCPALGAGAGACAGASVHKA